MSLPTEVVAAVRGGSCRVVLGPAFDGHDARLHATGLHVFPWDSREDDPSVRAFLRGGTVLYVGFRPDRVPFPAVHARLETAWGRPLPRCHLAVCGSPMGDAVWQKWVWKGVLPFLTEPDALLRDLEEALA
jgi:hypothetical protein